ncbi:Golgi integral membrane protein 4-like [Cotesia glomerata]|uniref:Golgi integral membrane protein 4-like n=1 Tax=Cotesia glomerata TaxID=32391 RepID=UPI001D00D6DE|nr:Golgi integral membrane protein 4-like [Cotesia glomerata]XP_044579287.1 Golgi integral membrane protein 4-like [Cotesia glomerata]XP_044579288.1 Golgi integral membrane protein 4-like [Cotesia glomerata]
MTGSRLGRGRGGRLAVYGGCAIVVFLLVFLYRAATTEMTRLRELHVQCTHQQEALAAQLQVIFEYKERLEKSLTEEKNSNAAAKHDLQERANREKSLRDKDSIEALQRFNSLQQEHKLLKTEHQDLRDECEKVHKQALEERSQLETTLQMLRSQIKKAQEDKEQSMEHLKNKYMELETEKTKIEKNYNELMKSNGNTDSTIEHLRKEVFQLQRELEDSKASCKSAATAVEKGDNKAVESVGQPSVEKEPKKRLAQQQSAPSPQQINLVVNVAKESTVGSYTKSSTNSSSIVSSDKLLRNAVVAPVKSASRGKLPVGVLPIPKLVDQKVDTEELKKINLNRISLSEDNKKSNNNLNIDGNNNLNRNSIHNNHNGVRQTKNSEEAPGNIEHDVDKHVADQILGRQENPPWYRVKPGVQEIGDEPNHLRKLPEHDVAIQQGDNEQYDNGDYYKEPQQKNSDINLEEGEEEEEEEEDGDEEPFDYQNNAGDKHK